MKIPRARIRMAQHCLMMFLALASAGTVLSLEADNSESITYNADGQIQMRIEGGVRILDMQDNVIVTQGTLVIRGDNAVIELDVDTGELRRVTVSGSPANYQQELDREGTLVNGSSDRLLFYRDESDNSTVLEFIGNARIESPDSSMHCAAIVYLADQDLIREATGPCQGSLSSN